MSPVGNRLPTWNGRHREETLHLPIVRQNCRRSIVLKQKSIAFGCCPLKCNEFLFNNFKELGT